MIQIISPDIGGGFGGKVPVYPGYVCCAVASLVLGRPVKWIEDRSENLQADSFARDYHITPSSRPTRTARSSALQVKTLSDCGAADAAANPSKFPAGLYSICTGSYDMKAAHVTVDGVYTNKPPGGVAYRCSFRVTEAVHMIERMVDILAHQLGEDPADFRLKNFIRPDQFPYKSPTGWEYDSGNYKAALDKAMTMIDYRALRKEQLEKRARGELMGIGISSFTEVVGAGPSKDYDILGIKMFDSAEIRIHPTGKAMARFGTKSQGQGHETTYAQIVAEELGLPASRHPGRGGRHRHRAVRPRHLRQPLDADRGRRGGDGRAQDQGEGQEDRGAPARGRRGRSRVERRQLPGQGLARQEEDDPGDRVRRVHQPPAGHGGRARGDGLLRSAEPDVPVRQLHLRRRHRSAAPARSRSGASSRSTTAATSSTR